MKLRSIVALLLSVVMLIACASFGVAETEKTKVTIWHTFTDAQEAALLKAAADFSAASDKYEVEVLSQAYSGFLNSVYNAVTNDVGPDIIFNYASEAAEYVNLGRLTNLSKYIYSPEIGIEGFDESLSEGVLYGEVDNFTDGMIHYLPGYTTGPILYYNVDMFNELGLEVPTTWAEMEQVAKTIYEAKGTAGLGFDSLTDCIQMIIMEAENSGYIDVENKCVNFDTEEVRTMIRWLVDCAKNGYFAVTASGDYFSTDFNSKIVGCYIGSCAGYPYIKPDGFEFAMAPMPAESWYPSWNRGPIVFYYNDDARAEGAYEFVKYFISPEVNLEWVIACNALSPYSTTQALEGYKEYIAQDTLAIDALMAVAEHLDIAGSLPAITGASTVRNAIRDAVVKAVNGEMTADEAWTEAVILSNEALAK